MDPDYFIAFISLEVDLRVTALRDGALVNTLGYRTIFVSYFEKV